MKSVIIDRLIQIEEEARNITKGIEQKEAGLPTLIQSECEKIEARFKTDYEQKAKEVALAKEKECAEKLEEAEGDFSRRLKNLEQYFEENHKSWEDEIFNSITGR